ncbi:MAG: beta-ketoacyl-[acyl-carrier-protein] synthase II [Bdellovibrionales bacterium RBG_16_40_8]|nr:MAG: beta-ketoacyl-[acyl-carrier-protein] synthase II [Bdellovibrionales bacterium RBG_16_40_8]
MTPASPAGRRVVVTGLGAVTPLGLSANESFENALKGQSGIAPITLFDASKFDVKFAGEVKGFNPDPYVQKKEQKKMDRFLMLSAAATTQAVNDSGIEFTDELKERTGVFIGCGIGGLPGIEETTKTLNERGPGRISPFFIPQVITSMAPGNASIQYGLKGPNFSMVSACATGCHNIGEAFHYIRYGMCDAMIAGGAEGAICGLGVGGFAAMKALSTRNDSPQTASRPWDKDRDGFVLAEGAAVLILEEMELAKKREAKIYAEITGYGVSSDAYHMTNPAPGGAGAVKAMIGAIRSAKVNASDIGYINAHGTSTPVGDLAESEAIKKALGVEAAKKTWISSTKSMTGHALGAAGAIESVFSILALYHGKIPPTINLENPSPECDLDYVPLAARERKLNHVLNNSFGFGGTNACIIFSK